LGLPDVWYDRLKPREEDVREALVVSAVTLERDPKLDEGDVRRSLEPADGDKCARCWKYLPLGSDPQHPSLCSSCAQIVRAKP
jgi:isoleucyl-tRNA synthetase